MRTLMVVFVALVLLSSSIFAQEQSAQGAGADATGDEDAEAAALAKKSQNPIANIISLPLQNNTSFDNGPEGATVNIFNIQPVYPISTSKFNIINRFILPVIYRGELVEGAGTASGLGDLSYSAFFSPAKEGNVTWGVGPSFLIPTATDDLLGSGKWSAGFGAVILAMPGKWVIGVLAQNVWSFAGDKDRADVKSLLAQYFINYNIKNGWYLSTAPVITANWEADSDNRWTIPFGGGFGKLVKFGKLPVDMQTQVFYNVEKPAGVGDWVWRLQFKMLFPK